MTKYFTEDATLCILVCVILLIIALESLLSQEYVTASTAVRKNIILFSSVTVSVSNNVVLRIRPVGCLWKPSVITSNKHGRQNTHNVTPRRIRATIVAVEK